MNLSIEQKGAAILLTVQEERLDAHNSGELKAQMLKLFEEGKNNLIVDLQAVRFVDSSGLGTLVSGIKNASSRNGSLKLSGFQPNCSSGKPACPWTSSPRAATTICCGTSGVPVFISD